VSGLGSWVQSQWVDRQRRLWREHDAKLAEVWHEDSLASAGQADVGKQFGGGPTDVGTNRDAGKLADVIVLPDAQGDREGSPIGS